MEDITEYSHDPMLYLYGSVCMSRFPMIRITTCTVECAQRRARIHGLLFGPKRVPWCIIERNRGRRYEMGQTDFRAQTKYSGMSIRHSDVVNCSTHWLLSSGVYPSAIILGWCFSPENLRQAASVNANPSALRLWSTTCPSCSSTGFCATATGAADERCT